MIILEKLKTGTTTVGMVCKDGVILAADRKATMGNIVASKDAKKIFEITDSMAMTVAGGVGDAQALVRLLKAEARLYELQEKKITTKSMATLLANMLRSSYKSFLPEMVQLILAGYDNESVLYSIDLSGGLSPEEDYTFTGSGSVVAVGVLEDSYKKNMSIDDGMKLLVKALKAARERDIYTGGHSVDIVTITRSGVRFTPRDKVKELLK